MKRWGTSSCKLLLFFLEITTLGFSLPLSHFNVNTTNNGVFFLNIMSGEANLQLYFPRALKVRERETIF